MITWIKNIFKRKKRSQRELVPRDTNSAPCYAIVEHDNTLSGDGTLANPLKVEGSGSITVVEHDSTLSGDGTATSLLSVTDPFSPSDYYTTSYIDTAIGTINGEINTIDGNIISILSSIGTINGEVATVTTGLADLADNLLNNYYDKAGIDHEFLFYYTKSDINSEWLVKSITGTNGVTATTSNGVATLSANLSAGTGITLGTGNPKSIAVNESVFTIRNITAGTGITRTTGNNPTIAVDATVFKVKDITVDSTLTLTATNNVYNLVVASPFNSANYYTKANIDSGWLVKSIAASGLGITTTTSGGVTTINTNLTAGNGVTIGGTGTQARTINAPLTAGTGVSLSGGTAGVAYTVAVDANTYKVKDITAGSGVTTSGTDNRTINAPLTAGNGISITNGAAGAAHTIATNLTAGNGITISAAASRTIATNFTAGPGISISAASARVFKSELDSDSASGITITQGANGAAHKVAVNLTAGTGISITNGTGTAKVITATGSGGMTQVYHDNTLYGTGASSSNPLMVNTQNVLTFASSSTISDFLKSGEYMYSQIVTAQITRRSYTHCFRIKFTFSSWDYILGDYVACCLKPKSGWEPDYAMYIVDGSDTADHLFPFGFSVTDSSYEGYTHNLVGFANYRTVSNEGMFALRAEMAEGDWNYRDLQYPITVIFYGNYVGINF